MGSGISVLNKWMTNCEGIHFPVLMKDHGVSMASTFLLARSFYRRQGWANRPSWFRSLLAEVYEQHTLVKARKIAPLAKKNSIHFLRAAPMAGVMGFKRLRRNNKMENIVLFGGGSHAGYCIDIIEREKKYRIMGITDSLKEIGTKLFGYSVIGRQEQLEELIQKHHIQGGIITIGDNWSRKLVYDSVRKAVPGFKFVNAIHPSTIVGTGVTLGMGVVAMAGCILNPYSKVGDFCFLATGAQLEHDCEMGDFSSLSAGSITGGKVIIGKYSAITLGVIILDRVHIGENTVVGSGSLVTKHLPDNVLAYGNPAKIIRARKLGENFLRSD